MLSTQPPRSSQNLFTARQWSPTTKHMTTWSFRKRLGHIQRPGSQPRRRFAVGSFSRDNRQSPNSSCYGPCSPWWHGRKAPECSAGIQQRRKHIIYRAGQYPGALGIEGLARGIYEVGARVAPEAETSWAEGKCTGFGGKWGGSKEIGSTRSKNQGRSQNRKAQEVGGLFVKIRCPKKRAAKRSWIDALRAICQATADTKIHGVHLYFAKKSWRCWSFWHWTGWHKATSSWHSVWTMIAHMAMEFKSDSWR